MRCSFTAISSRIMPCVHENDYTVVSTGVSIASAMAMVRVFVSQPSKETVTCTTPGVAGPYHHGRSSPSTWGAGGRVERFPSSDLGSTGDTSREYECKAEEPEQVHDGDPHLEEANCSSR